MRAAQFEPVYLEPEGPALLTEYGKGWLDRWHSGMERSRAILRDVAELAKAELLKWPEVQRRLDAEGVPQMISSGLSNSQMAAMINASTKNATYTAPAAFFLALCTAAPTNVSTGVTIAEATYTGYARANSASVMGAASTPTAGNPSIATNSGGAITFAACTGGTSTLLGFALCDSGTTGAGAALWYGTLTSTVISSTQTPATVASSALSLSLTGT